MIRFSSNSFLLFFIVGLFLGWIGMTPTLADGETSEGIKPYSKNPRYWQYRGQPVLLLGGTKNDNIFQTPDVEEHLELLCRIGGNYVRCVMSGRDKGDAWPFVKEVDGKYDLTHFNEEYWKRFDRFLELTHRRKIIVQIEVWAFHDFFGQYGAWQSNPWRPANNSNYATDRSGLKQVYSAADQVCHDFFVTVPKLNNNRIVLEHQQRFVDRLLESTLPYDHVLYCMTNEIHPLHPPGWGWHWAEYIRQRADLRGKQVETSEMYWQTDLKNSRHRHCLDHPETYTFFEASQNSARSGQENWDNLQHVWHSLSSQPRPINHVKIYGADSARADGWEGSDSKAAACFWRNIMGGSASSRFHRPTSGLGLNPVAQAHIHSMRMLASEFELFRAEPDSKSHLLADRESNEAYLTRIDGEQYAVYFPNGGSVRLDLVGAKGPLTMKWLDITHSRWNEPQTIDPNQQVKLSAPGPKDWAVVIKVTE